MDKYKGASSSCDKLVNKKAKNTCLDKYGFTSPLLNKEIKEKTKDTLLKKYGVDHVSRIPSVIEHNKDIALNKQRQGRYANYGLFIPNKIDVATNPWTLYFTCDKCGKEFLIGRKLLQQRLVKGYNPCTNCCPINISVPEKELLDFINELLPGRVVISKSRILNNKELDVFIPSLNIGFEMNGIYWHSNIPRDNSYDSKYHLNKTALAESKGISLTHIWEDDWINKKDIIKSKISNIFNLQKYRIYARKCRVEVITSKRSRKFLDDNHLQGSVNGSVRFGLIYENELVAVMVFSKSRVSLGQKDTSAYEMLRFCVKRWHNVIGASNILLEKFVRQRLCPCQIVVGHLTKSTRSSGLIL